MDFSKIIKQFESVYFEKEYALYNAKEIEKKKDFYFNKSDLLESERFSLFEFFTFLSEELESLDQYLQANYQFNSEDFHNLFFDLTYTFIIFFDFEEVKNPIVQRISIEFLNALVFKESYENNDLETLNRIITKLHELNSWEESSNLFLKFLIRN